MNKLPFVSLLLVLALFASCNHESAASSPPAQTFVSDMGPDFVQTFVDSHWGFGGRGTIGTTDFLKITANEVPYPHGLGTQPPSNGSAHVYYTLDHPFSKLTGKAAINDTGSDSTTPLTFRINGDGRELWHSSQIKGKSQIADFSLDISQVKHLEFAVDCPGSNSGAHAVWLDPTLVP